MGTAACTPPTSSPSPGTSTSPSPTARADVAGLVDIGGDRKLYVECRGIGSPTVVLISTGNASSQEWKLYADVAQQKVVMSDQAVFPTIAKQTRTCVYDRPGTRLANGERSPSTIIPQPTTAGEDVEQLRAALTAAGEQPPYVVAGGSWGGMIAQTFARTQPDEVRGLVLVDSASSFLPCALTAQQWKAFLAFADSLDPQQYEVPDYPTSITELAADPPLQDGLPTVVLSSDEPWQLVPTLAAAQTFPRWTTAQRELAASLRAEHVTDTMSGHLVAVDNPKVVSAAITSVLGRADR